MLVKYLRSSSIGTYNLCAQKFMLTYCFGFREPGNQAAEKGSLCHCVFETLAQKKLCLQTNKTEFDNDTFGTMHIDECNNINKLIDRAYDHFSKESLFKWTPKDKRDVTTWIHDTLQHANGVWNPLNREIFAVEHFFDIELPFDWAKYYHKFEDGHIIEGNIRLRGSIDLIVLENAATKTLSICDWKTGSCFNFKTFKPKTFEDLRNEPQFLIYYWAAHQMFPGYEILFDVFYCKDGGPSNLGYTPHDVDRGLEVIKSIYMEIRSNIEPKLNVGKVCSFCPWSKLLYKDSGETYCEFFRDKIDTIGLDKTFELYADLKTASSYEGGGKSLTLES